MTLDDEHLTWRHAAQLQEDEDDRRAYEEWQEQVLTESPEAIESYWKGVFACSPPWARDALYDLDRG